MGILRNVGSFVSSLFSDGKISYRTSEPSTLTQSNAKPSEPPPPPKPAEAQLTSFQHATVELAPFYPASWSRAPANFGTSSDPLSFSNTSIKSGGIQRWNGWDYDGADALFDLEPTYDDVTGDVFYTLKLAPIIDAYGRSFCVLPSLRLHLPQPLAGWQVRKLANGYFHVTPGQYRINFDSTSLYSGSNDFQSSTSFSVYLACSSPTSTPYLTTTSPSGSFYVEIAHVDLSGDQPKIYHYALGQTIDFVFVTTCPSN